ncbi:MAG: peptide ABC transporter substrate-binding protein [Bacteroidota bacterium]|nr:peptide ABC transporter substrate-binding protein [Bacteroidota bacterium]
MKKTLIFSAIVALFIASCSGDKTNSTEKPVAKGGKVYGGYLRISESDIYQTLNPVSITDAVSGFVATQIHDGLVKLNMSTLKVESSLAEKWEVDPSGTKYTFYIKKGAFFQDDECFSGGTGREIKASDFKYAFELLCKKADNNENFTSTFKDRVAGATESFNSGKSDVQGIKVIDDYKLEITLAKPSTVFLQILAEPACAVVAKEAVEKYGKDIKSGAGAFIYDNVSSGKEKVVLKRNANYHGKDTLGNQLPFLDSIVIYIVPTKEQELTMFKDGKLDMITSLPSQSVKEMVESQIKDFQTRPPKYLLDNSPEMITQYYSFNTKKAPFDNVKVRRAFNYAINRQKIVDEILNGQAYGPGIKGITPPTFTIDGYDISSINGYDFNVTEAKKLLAEAGYPNGKGFPAVKVILNSGGARNSNVVVEIQKQLMENLNVNIDFDVVPYAKKLEEARSGRADIIRDAWIADFPSPESFLHLFYGANVPADLNQSSFPNTSRFQNTDYDKYYVMGRDAKSKDSSMAYFLKAEQILMNEAPLMPLWYEGNYRLTQFYVKDAFTNPMRYRNYSSVYIKEGVNSEVNDGTKSDSAK